MTDTALVYIRKADETREFAGCGVLIEGPYIATCRHVWRDAEGEENGRVIVEFPRSLDGGGVPEWQSVGMADACDATIPAPDLVLLSVGPLPAGVYPLPVATEARFETGAGRIHAFKKSRGTDVFVSGTIQPGTTGKGLRQISGEADSGYWTEKGSSGSPAFLDNGMQLAGILLLSETGNPPERVAFILPGSAIRRQLERIKADAVAAEMGVSVSALEHAIPGLDLKDTPVSEIAAKIAAAVAAITAKASEAPVISNSGTDIDDARAVAASKLGHMDTKGALAVWDDLLNKDHEALETLTRRRVAMLVEKATIHRLRLEYSAALAALREIVRIDPGAYSEWVDIGDIESETGTLENSLPAYLSARDAARLRADEHSTVVCLQRIGDALRSRNELGPASEIYREGLEIARRLSASETKNANAWRNVSILINKIGEVLEAQNDLGGAQVAYEEGLAIQRILLASDASSIMLACDVSMSLNGIGDILRLRHDYFGAFEAYNEGLAIVRRLVIADPTEPMANYHLAASLDRIGDACSGRNDFGEALVAFHEALVILRNLAAANPSNSQSAMGLALTIGKIGNFQLEQNDLANAIKSYEESLEICRRLFAANPSNSRLAYDLSVALEGMGRALKAQGDLDGALSAYREALGIRRRLMAEDMEHADHAHNVALSLSGIGKILFLQDDFAGALEAYEQGLEIERSLMAKASGNADWAHGMFVSLAYIGVLFRIVNNKQAACDHLKEAHTIIKGLAEAAPDMPNLQRELEIIQRELAETGCP
jgi:tetratricopeptide (TPR) repeat protein